jgi:hypothetical protein
MDFNQNWKMVTKKSYLEDAENNCYEELIYDKLPNEILDGNVDYNCIAKDVTIPTCWENEGIMKSYPGPVWFIKEFKIDNKNNTKKLLKFNAVSYFCKVWLNGKLIAEHKGMWDSFTLDVSKDILDDNTLILEVHKTGGIFDTTECLTGFIPYVTSTFGGIWQKVELIESDYIINDLKVFPCNDDEQNLKVEFELFNYSMQNKVNLEYVFNDLKAQKLINVTSGKNIISLDLDLPKNKKHWSHKNPYLYELKVVVSDYEFCSNIGLRNIGKENSTFKVNSEPIYLRGVLNWMAYTDTIAPILSEERIKDEMLKIKSMGFNLIKLCLVIPDEKYFKIADELGIYLWVEFPLWLPKVTDYLKNQAKIEYANIVKKIRKHPSVIIYSLGCELNSDTDSEFLNDLSNIVKNEINDELLAANSGSGEAYGGVETINADFYDYHFYTETYHFTELYNYFYPLWKERKPLFFGEYCDCDSFRSITSLKNKLGMDKLWWTEEDPIENPQGVRWEYNVVKNEGKIEKLKSTRSVVGLEKLSKIKPLECRKDIIEQTRRLSTTSGYVLTVNIDTPISTSGLIDDLGNVKYPVDKFKEFNSDCVLSIERGKRRIFRHGDRQQYIDEFNTWQGDEFSVNLILSNYLKEISDARLEYQLLFKNSSVTDSLDMEQKLEQGKVSRISQILAKIPKENENYEFLLKCCLKSHLGKTLSENSWTFNAIRKIDYSDININLFDWSNYLYNSDLYNEKLVNIDYLKKEGDSDINVFTSWSNEIKKLIEEGKKTVLIIPEGAPFTEEHSFYRECMPYFEKDSFLNGLPIKDYGGISFKGIGPDRSISLNMAEMILNVKLKPVMTRLDEVKVLETYYILEGKNIIITTLRLFGGLTGQPVGFHKNVLGTYLFTKMLEHLN